MSGNAPAVFEGAESFGLLLHADSRAAVDGKALVRASSAAANLNPLGLLPSGRALLPP